MAESPTMEVRARVSADSAQFVQGMDRAAKSTEQFQQAAQKVNGAVTALGVSVGIAAGSMIAFGVKALRSAAEVEELDIALRAVGASSGQGYEALKTASDTMRQVGIRAAVAQRMTLKFAQSNVDLSESAKLATVAQDLSVVSSMSAESALERLTMAVTTGQSRVLRSVGITDSGTGAYERYAASIGKAAKDLTMTERRQAVMNFVMREGSKVAGTYAIAMKSPAKLLNEFGELNKELQVAMGGALLAGFGPIIKATYRFNKAIVESVNEGGRFHKIVEALEGVILKITEPIADLIDRFTDFIESSDMAGVASEKLAGQMSMLLPAVAGATAGLSALAGRGLANMIPMLRSFTVFMKPIPIALAAIALTSPQVQSALRNLVSAFAPLVPILKTIGTVLTTGFAYAIAIVAKAIDGVAALVRRFIGFLQRFATQIKIATIAFGVLAVAILATKIPMAIAIVQSKLLAAKKYLLAKASLALSKAQAILASSLFLPVLAIAAVIAAIILLYQHSESFREGFTNVFNTVAKYVGEALAWVISGIGNLLIAFGQAISPATSFGQTLIGVAQFMYTAFLTSVQGILRAILMFLKAINFASKSTTGLGKVVRAVLNFIFKAFAVVVGGILKFIGMFLEVLGMLLDTHGLVGKIIGMVLDFLWKAFATVIGGIIKFIGMFIEFLGNLLDTNAFVGKLIAGIIEFVGDAFLTVLGSIFKLIGTFIGFLGDLLDANSGVGKAIAKVLNFIASVYLTTVEKIAGFLAKGIDAIISFVKGNRQGLETALDLFNKFAEGVGKALAAIPNFLAFVLEKIGAFFKNAAKGVADFITKAADGLRLIPKVGAQLAAPLDAAAAKMLSFGNTVETTLTNAAKPLRSFATSITNATKQIISDTALDTLIKKAEGARNALNKISQSAGTLKEREFGTELLNSISSTLTKISSTSNKIGNTIFESVKVPMAEGLIQGISDALTKVGGFTKKIGETVIEAGDIKMGTELVQMLSDASKFIGGAVKKVGEFVTELKQFEVGDILMDVVENVTDFAIPKIESLINTIEGLKDLPVGKFLIENLSEKSIQAGEKLLTFATAVKSFTSENTLQKLTDGFGNLADKLKEALGFGDILKKEQEKIDELTRAGATDDGAADAIQNQADIMKKIRDAMAAGIESMRDVLQDLQDAAKQFADSLKDTILGFAGLKGVELPDGFIPKAKSLIENMRMRLDKSQQFANQITTLQGLGLDAKAIQDLVEQGPIKGAQLAASILGGGAEAIAQINELQKQIGFTGEFIGAMGSEAAFGQKIANAFQNISEVEAEAMRVRGLGGNNIVIEQGAFVVNVDTTGITDVDEKADLITQRIQETFAILAKELANK